MTVRVAVEPVLGHHRGDVRVVVLHRAAPAGRRRARGPSRRTGSRGAGRRPAAPGRTPVSARRCVAVRSSASSGGEVVHVADVLAEPGVAALGDAAGVLQVGADRQRRPRPSNGSATGSGAYPRERRIGSSAPSTTRTPSRRRARGSRRSWRSQASAMRREPLQRLGVVGDDRLAGQVAGRHHQHVGPGASPRAEQQRVQRRVRQHDAEVGVAGRHRVGARRSSARARQQHDRPARCR